MRIPRQSQRLTPAQRQKRLEKMERRRAQAAERKEVAEEFPFVGPMNRAQALAQFREELPLHGAWRWDNPEEPELRAVVARRMENGNLVFDYFAIDRTGKGVVECFGSVDFTESRFDRAVLERLREEDVDLQPADADQTQRLIRAAVARAEEAGNLPEEWEEIHGLIAPLPEGEEPDYSLLNEVAEEAEPEEAEAEPGEAEETEAEPAEAEEPAEPEREEEPAP